MPGRARIPLPDDPSVPFPYMRWAKRHLGSFAPRNLGMSGVRPLTADDLALPADLPYWAPEGEHGDRALRDAIARHEGVEPERVFATAGTSLANFLVYLSEARGAPVAVETPAYESLPRTAEVLGGRATPFRRDEARGWRVDPDSLRRALVPGTRLVVVSDLHNPSGAALAEEDLALLAGEAERVGARVLVDEVYRDLSLLPRASAAVLDPRVVVTNSLTKAHGLGGLRVGWILAPREVVARVEAVNDLVCPAHPTPSIAIAKAYLPGANARLEEIRAEAAERLAVADAWVAGREDVSWVRPAGGVTGLLRLRDGLDGDRLAAHALARRGVQVVPGSFFQAPGHVRVSYGLPADDLRAALASLGEALDDLAR
jgi:aspartate/methionine/tyrosine aminotransferase